MRAAILISSVVGVMCFVLMIIMSSAPENERPIYTDWDYRISRTTIGNADYMTYSSTIWPDSVYRNDNVKPLSERIALSSAQYVKTCSYCNWQVYINIKYELSQSTITGVFYTNIEYSDEGAFTDGSGHYKITLKHEDYERIEFAKNQEELLEFYKTQLVLSLNDFIDQ